jgi:two-component system sensor histidine kinase KdpD
VYGVLVDVVKGDLKAQEACVCVDARQSAAHQYGTYELPLQSSEQTYGSLVAEFEHRLTTAQFNLLSTCVSQAAQALERIDLMARAIKGQQFEEADKLKTAILYSVSHDLRTPITIIKTSANNLQHLRGQLNPSDEIQIAETIEHEADQLDQLVGHLLDMSRLQAGALLLNCQPNSLEEMVGDAVARVWELTKQKRITLHFEDMPLINFDYGLMRQAVSNLIENSLRYEPSGRQIEIRGSMNEADGRLDIINHGESIPDDLKERVMEPFYRGKQGRTGLGLPIAKGIIEAHQGHLKVEDTPEGGATFVVTLPFTQGTFNET